MILMLKSLCDTFVTPEGACSYTQSLSSFKKEHDCKYILNYLIYKVVKQDDICTVRTVRLTFSKFQSDLFGILLLVLFKYAGRKFV